MNDHSIKNIKVQNNLNTKNNSKTYNVNNEIQSSSQSICPVMKTKQKYTSRCKLGKKSK